MSHSDEPVISVLVADDDEDQRVLIKGLLEHADGARHAVTCVVDGSSALTALREQVFDVVLLDLSMPVSTVSRSWRPWPVTPADRRLSSYQGEARSRPRLVR